MELAAFPAIMFIFVIITADVHAASFGDTQKRITKTDVQLCEHSTANNVVTVQTTAVRFNESAAPGDVQDTIPPGAENWNAMDYERDEVPRSGRHARDIRSKLISQMADLSSVSEQLSEPRLLSAVTSISALSQTVQQRASLFDEMPDMGAVGDLPKLPPTISPVTRSNNQYGPPSVPFGASDVAYGSSASNAALDDNRFGSTYNVQSVLAAPPVSQAALSALKPLTNAALLPTSQFQSNAGGRVHSRVPSSRWSTLQDVDQTPEPALRSPSAGTGSRQGLVISLSDGTIRLDTGSGPQIQLMTGGAGGNGFRSGSQDGNIVILTTGASKSDGNLRTDVSSASLAQRLQSSNLPSRNPPASYSLPRDPTPSYTPPRNPPSAYSPPKDTASSGAGFSSFSRGPSASASVAQGPPISLPSSISSSVPATRQPASWTPLRGSSAARDDTAATNEESYTFYVGQTRSFPPSGSSTSRSGVQNALNPLLSQRNPSRSSYSAPRDQPSSYSPPRDPPTSYRPPPRDPPSPRYGPPARDPPRDPPSPSYGPPARDPPRDPPSPRYGPPARDPPRDPPSSSYGPPARDPPRDPPSQAYGPPARDPPRDPPSPSYGPPARDPPRDPPSPAYGPPARDPPRDPPSPAYGPPARDPPRDPPSPSYGPPARDPPRDPPSPSYGPPARDSPRDPPSNSYGPPARDPPQDPPSNMYTVQRDPVTQPPSRDPIPVIIMNPPRLIRKRVKQPKFKPKPRRVKDTIIREISYPDQSAATPVRSPAADPLWPQSRPRVRTPSVLAAPLRSPANIWRQRASAAPASWGNRQRSPPRTPGGGVVRDTLVREVMYDKFAGDYKQLFYKGALLIGAMALLPTVAVVTAPIGRRRRRRETDEFSLFDQLPDAGAELPESVRRALKSYLPEIPDPDRSQCLQMSLCQTIVQVEQSPFRESFLLYYAVLSPDVSGNPWMQQALTAARKRSCHRFLCQDGTRRVETGPATARHITDLLSSEKGR